MYKSVYNIPLIYIEANNIVRMEQISLSSAKELFRLGKVTECFQQFDQLLKRDDEQSSLNASVYAAKLIQVGFLVEAKQILNEWRVKCDSKNETSFSAFKALCKLHYAYGKLLYANNDYENSLLEYQKVVELCKSRSSSDQIELEANFTKKQHAKALENKASVKCMSSNYTDALRLMDQAEEVYRNNKGEWVLAKTLKFKFLRKKAVTLKKCSYFKECETLLLVVDHEMNAYADEIDEESNEYKVLSKLMYKNQRDLSRILWLLKQ